MHDKITAEECGLRKLLGNNLGTRHAKELRDRALQFIWKQSLYDTPESFLKDVRKLPVDDRWWTDHSIRSSCNEAVRRFLSPGYIKDVLFVAKVYGHPAPELETWNDMTKYIGMRSSACWDVAVEVVCNGNYRGRQVRFCVLPDTSRDYLKYIRNGGRLPEKEFKESTGIA
ncbi:MAG: hypothetical protein WBB28_01250 [Crinalium sp.]